MNQLSIEKPSNGGNLPRAVLLGAAALVAFSLIASVVAHFTDVGTLHMPALKSVLTLSLRFEDRDDGGIDARDATSADVIYTVAPGTNGFIRSTLRGLARERHRSGLDASTPFLLTHWSDSTVSLADKATGRSVSLDAFGPTNAQAFARLFGTKEATP